jgi:polyisoprenyl-phosphate glycosyltransferase
MKKRLVIVVPVYNESKNVGLLVERVGKAAAPLASWACEVLFVDDGSTDGTLESIRGLQAKGLPVSCIALSRNFGHQAALLAGLEAAEGDAVITMDADLQHPPEEIPLMVKAFEEGNDVVQMVRSEPAGGLKGMLSDLFYKIFASLTSVNIIMHGADFRLLSRRIVKIVREIPERDKFLRGLVPSLGFRQTVLKYDEGKRIHGTPSYSFMQSFKMAGKALFNYSLLPLLFVFWMGTLMAVVSFAFGLGHLVKKLIVWESVTPGFTDIITAIFFLSGCTLASIGILGRYLVIVIRQLRGRPTFIVAERVPPLSSESEASHEPPARQR